MVKIVECEWKDWCPKDCNNKYVMRIINRDGYGSYMIEQPIEENLGNCDYYRVNYDGMSVIKQIKRGKNDG